MNIFSEEALKSDSQFFMDVVEGLNAEAKSLPCKYFYDEKGSQLFDEICVLDEYYLTRAELSIMEHHASSIAYQIGERVMLVEYGSGSSVKTRILLDELESAVAYVPVDISEEHLLKTADQLQLSYPEVEILPVVADFVTPFELPVSKRAAAHVAVYFPGSTIGNFTPYEAGKLIANMAGRLGKQGGLLIGIDLQKDPAILEAAYNDAQGVTSAFNLNLLTRINNQLNGNFDLNQFRHRAVYNSAKHRIEITIESQCRQTVAIGDHDFDFAKGEEILTEYCHKYTIAGFARLASQYGFSLHQHWTDENELFAVLHLVLDD